MMPDLQRLRVLVAEDEFFVANDIAHWLEQAGATPDSAGMSTATLMRAASNFTVARSASA